MLTIHLFFSLKKCSIGKIDKFNIKNKCNINYDNNKLHYQINYDFIKMIKTKDKFNINFDNDKFTLSDYKL